VSADVDIAIVGAGCAGLSLAIAMQRQNISRRVMLLEPRTKYVSDRTWCFWDTEPHPFIDSVSHRWDSWRVSSGARSVTQRSRRYNYCHLDSGDFYKVALAAVESCPTQELRMGVRVSKIAARADGLQGIDTDQGQLSARLVLDSRPPVDVGTGDGAPSLVQRFVGWRVRSARGVFQPETVELMRFLPSDVQGRVRFIYVLPFSSTEALVEMTYLDLPQLAPADAEAALRQWCDQLGTAYEVLYREQGALPMGGARLGKPTAEVHAIGIRGGRLKPSSGYGFVRIQRHSAAIARAIAEGAALPADAEPAIYRYLDSLFVAALSRSPGSAEALFLGLFERAEPDKLVRFLSERSSVGEALRVALSLPRMEMLHALAQRGEKTNLLRNNIAGHV
jgi:lycopene beta-cyclase